MKPPACGPGDLCVAQRAESTLFIPEIAKSTVTPKRAGSDVDLPCSVGMTR